MTEEVVEVWEEPPVAELHLYRGAGLWYGVGSAVLLVLGIALPISYLLSGRWVIATLCAVFLLFLGWFFSRLSLPMLRTRLTADTAGVRGRSPDGQVVDLGWNAVGIDAEDGLLLLLIGPETIRLDPEGWVGFWDFVALLCRVPAAAARLTPAGGRAVARLLDQAMGIRGRSED